MYVICVDLKIRPDRHSDFMTSMKRQSENSLMLEPGCKRFDICVDPVETSNVFLYELYDDERACDAHFSSKHYEAFDQADSEMVMTKSVRRFKLV